MVHPLLALGIILIIYVLCMLFVTKQIKKSKKYFNEVYKKADKLYVRIENCNSSGAWVHWLERVNQFAYEHPDEIGWELTLRKKLNERAVEILEKERKK